MKTIWFKKIGWIYFPVSVAGYAIAAFTLLLIVHDFWAVDRNSHSVSDTYYNFIPYAFIYFGTYMWVGHNTSEK